MSRKLSPGAAATLACLYEATAPKPGNVHPGADFDDVAYADFVASAVVTGPILDQAGNCGVGRSVLEAVRATREAVGTNTNLGTLLLMGPLAAVPPDQALVEGIGGVLDRLNAADTRCVYEAIRLAGAGGLGRAESADVASEPPAELRLVDAMRLAVDRDRVAVQYTNQFTDVFTVAESIREGVERGWPLSTAIVFAHVREIAHHGDSLIGRKCGPEINVEASRLARAALESGAPADTTWTRSIDEFDAWLRADGHRRNPGTTADLVAAGLFVLLREGQLRRWQRW